MPDDYTYGLSENDAIEVISLLGKTDGEYPEGKARGGRKPKLGKTSGAISSGGTGTVLLYDRSDSSPYWTISTTEVTAYSPFSAIATDTNVYLATIDGRYVAFEVC